MIGCISWVLMAGAEFCFWSYDWRLGLGLTLAALSFMVDVGHGFQQLSEAIKRVDRRFYGG